MSIPQLDVQFYKPNVLWSIIFFIIFSLLFRYFLYPVYKKIQKEQDKQEKNQKLLEKMAQEQIILDQKISTEETHCLQQEDKNQFIEKNKATILLQQYHKEQDEKTKEIIKKKLLEAEKHEDLQWILDNFKDK